VVLVWKHLVALSEREKGATDMNSGVHTPLILQSYIWDEQVVMSRLDPATVTSRLL